MVRQWVEYYLARVRTETVWDALSKEQLKSVLEVRTLCFLVVRVVRWSTINQSIVHVTRKNVTSPYETEYMYGDMGGRVIQNHYNIFCVMNISYKHMMRGS